MKVAIAGASHPHISYFTDELRARQGVLDLVGVQFDPGDDPATMAGLPPAPVYETVEDLVDRSGAEVLMVCGIYRQRIHAVTVALERGMDVLADKPVVVDPADLARLEQASEASSAVLSIAFEKRWYPATLQARALIAAGVIGEVRHLSATGPHRLAPSGRPGWYFDGGYGDLVADLPIHDIDLAILLTGARSGSVRATRSGRPEFPTLCTVSLSLDTGALASIDANWLWPEASPEPCRYQARVTGTRGVIELDFTRPDVRLVSGTRIDLPRVTPLRPAEEFFSARLAGHPPEVSTADSLTATRIALAASVSAEAGQAAAWSAYPTTI